MSTVRAIKGNGKAAIVEIGDQGGITPIAGPVLVTELDELAQQVKDMYAQGTQMYDACMQSLLTKFGYKPPVDC